MHRSIWLSAALAAAAVCLAGGADAKPKPLNLAACPAWGSETQGSARAALNEVKKRVPPAGTPTMLVFPDFNVLQQQGDKLVTSGKDSKVSAKGRAKLHALEIPGGTHVGEGDLVSMVGYMTGKPSVNPGESANCYLAGVNNNDFEFSIAPSADGTPYQGVVAEMIPQDRPKAWTLSRLRKLANEHRQVLIVGQLMFDTRHVPNPKPGTNHESPRFSTWEIHPVTKMLVCAQPTGGCDAKQEGQWTLFENAAEK
jgi:hypothetical protein